MTFSETEFPFVSRIYSELCKSLTTDVYLVVLCGVGVFVSMLLVSFSAGVTGTAASFGVFAVSYCFGPTTIIDSTRTAMWDGTVFGSAYAIKITMNNA